MCIVCYVVERIESVDPSVLMRQFDDISTIQLSCSCHGDIMLVALSSILILGGDNTRRILTNCIITHILHTVPSLTLYQSVQGTSTIRRLSEVHRKLAIVANTLTDHMFICISDRARLVRYIMCIAGQSKGWLGYSALLAAVIGCPVPVENVMFDTTDQLVDTLLRDSRSSYTILQSTAGNPRYNCVVCDKTINSVTNFIHSIAGPRSDWQRTVRLVGERRQKRREQRNRQPQLATDTESTSSSGDEATDSKDDESQTQSS